MKECSPTERLTCSLVCGAHSEECLRMADGKVSLPTSVRYDKNEK